ncbi:uncharacterized protein FFE2_08585 [Fusarium fujikuroi]|uniref:Uncharacterized protein n=1 Tax=Fusarium fujikuroi TaxID=5127 RepID=A0A9Q9RSP2_FUSFU|nr:uncharacterized protein FFE2_08585 [Fusarium fujikuroi]VTT74596.1 unnamed protein product [Fusarium fujikuroi]
MSESPALEPATLKEFITSVFADGGEARCARFAHIKLPLYRDPQIPWIKAVAQAFDGDFEEKLIFVTTDCERQMNPVNLASIDVDAHKITFQGLLEYLRHSFGLVTTNAMYRWKAGTWNEGILPWDAIIILHLDPSLQADCVLALAGIVQWAIDMEVWPTSNTRILTMSTGDHLDQLSNLVRMRRSGHIIPFLDFSCGNDWPFVTEVSPSSDDDGIVRDICQVVGSDTEASHLIISFKDTDIIHDKLSESITKIKGSDTFQMGTVVAEVDPLFNFFESPGAGVVVLLRIPGDLALLPPVFHGYDNVHVVVSDRLPGREAWHHKSRQVVDFDRYASNQERWAQLWWLEQPAKQRYLYSASLPVEELLENGFHQHHRIEDDQLGGFIAMVYDVEEWGIDCSRTIQCFLGTGVRVREMKRRLEAQRILSKYQFSLPDLEAKVFRSILPVVHYNYRLALFVAADCDATVRLLKLQLAALLFVGIEYTLTIECGDEFFTMMNNEDNYHLMMDFCMGSVRCMANQGSLWLAFGLWRSYLLLQVSRSNGEMIPDFEGLAKEFDSFLHWDKTQALKANRLAQTMTSILKEQDVPVLDITIRNEMDITLDKDQQFKMQSHLFRAYMHHLTASCLDEGKMINVEYATMTEVEWFPGRNRLIALTPRQALWDFEDGNCMFGINHGHRWENGSLRNRDWVWIPQAVVVEWLAGTVPKSDLLKLLSVNCMEVDQTVDECVE